MKNLKNWFQLSITGLAMIILVSCKSKTETASYPSDNTENTAVPDQIHDSTVANTPEESITAHMNENADSKKGSADVSKNKAATMKRRTGKTSIGAISQNTAAKSQVSSTGVYEYSEVRPAYPGGQQALEDYIMNNITYPDAALNNEVQGTVQVQFTVDENGNISNVHALNNNLGNGLEDEAVRVVSSMPKWSAGMVRKKAVKSNVTIPITFRIEQ